MDFRTSCARLYRQIVTAGGGGGGCAAPADTPNPNMQLNIHETHIQPMTINSNPNRQPRQTPPGLQPNINATRTQQHTSMVQATTTQHDTTRHKPRPSCIPNQFSPNPTEEDPMNHNIDSVAAARKQRTLPLATTFARPQFYPAEPLLNRSIQTPARS